MYRQTIPRVVLYLAAAAAMSATACSYQNDGQMTGFQNFAVYSQSPAQVVDAVTDVLANQGALPADLADRLDPGLLDAFRTQRLARFDSESVSLGMDALARLVPAEFRRFIGEQGGRYVLELTVEPATDGGLKVTVVPTIIATVGDGEGPLGGRPLPSNGTLESTILDALTARLGG